MANESTRSLLAREKELRIGKAEADYETYLDNLARQYGLQRQGMESNLESRGILRSGEANVARARSADAEEAAKLAAEANLDYNRNMINVDYMKQLAQLMAATPATRTSGGTTAPAAPAAPATPAATTPATPAAPQYKPAPTSVVARQAETRPDITPVRTGTTTGTSTTTRPAITLPPGINFAALAAGMKPKPKTGGGVSGARVR